MRIVAERHVLALAAATQRDARVAANVSRGFGPDLNPPLHVERPVADGLHRDCFGLRLGRPTVVPNVVQGARRAAEHRVRDCAGASRINVDPRAAIRIEHGGQCPNARRAVNAPVREPENADAVGPVLTRETRRSAIGVFRFRRGSVPAGSRVSLVAGWRAIQRARFPSSSISIARATRVCRVCSRFASSIHCTYSRWCVYERPRKKLSACGLAARAA